MVMNVTVDHGPKTNIYCIVLFCFDGKWHQDPDFPQWQTSCVTMPTMRSL